MRRTIKIVSIASGTANQISNWVSTLMFMLLLFVICNVAHAQNIRPPISVGASPSAMAFSATTAQIYVVNTVADTVSVIDEASGTLKTSIRVGKTPSAIALNPATNRIYICNQGSNNVTVIDGMTNAAVREITVGQSPSAIVVNLATNRVYVTNFVSNSVSVIDGFTDVVTATVAVGAQPIAIELNPVTNKIYVANVNGNSVSVVDGVSNAVVATVPVGASPYAVSVNNVTDRIYVANASAGTVSTISGQINSVLSSAPVGQIPVAIAINPVTNKVYVANSGSRSVTVLNGNDGLILQTIITSEQPQAIAIDNATNKIYVANGASDSVTIIDGLTSAETSIAVGINPQKILFSPISGNIYTTNGGGNSVSVIASYKEKNVTRAINIRLDDALFGYANTITNSRAIFSFEITPLAQPLASGRRKLFYQVDTLDGAWTEALDLGNGSFTATMASQSFGPHLLYAHFTDAENSAEMNGARDLVAGLVTVYPFNVVRTLGQTITNFTLPTSAIADGSKLVLRATGGAIGGTVRFAVRGTPGACTLTESTITFTGRGICTVVAFQTADANYAAAPTVVQNIRVEAATPDGVPDSFSLVARLAQPTVTVITSAAIPISGINTSVPISITALASARAAYSIGCNGAFSTTPQTVLNSQTVCVRLTTSINNGQSTSAVLTIGGVSATFLATTIDYPAQNRYRLYIPATLGHLFTTDKNEYDVLSKIGSAYVPEGIDHKLFPRLVTKNGQPATPYYRLYFKNLRLHFWTADKNEYETLKAQTNLCDDEGIDGYLFPSAGVEGSIPLYRLVLKNTSIHHWTVDKNEYDVLTKSEAWLGEGGLGNPAGVVGYVMPKN